jgi:hypothetical protein
VINSNIAKEVVMEILRSRRDLAEKIVFDGNVFETKLILICKLLNCCLKPNLSIVAYVTDEFWDNLTVERAFFARVFCEYLKEVASLLQ